MCFCFLYTFNGGFTGFTLFSHNSFRWIKLSKCLDPFFLINNSISSYIDYFKHILKDSECRICIIRHLTYSVNQFAKLLKCNVSFSCSIETSKSIFWRKQVMMKMIAQYTKTRLTSFID